MAPTIPYRATSMHFQIHADILKQQAPRAYKPVRRNGRTHWRNYKRDVPGGITFVDLMRRHMEQVRAVMDAEMRRMIFA